MKIDIL